MSKELEALSRIEDCLYEDPYADRNDVSYENDIATIKQALLKTQTNENYKFYKVMIRQYSIMKNDNLCYVKFIKTNDIYHWIGKYYSSALEKVERIDYQEISEETFKNEKPRTYYKGELI